MMPVYPDPFSRFKSVTAKLSLFIDFVFVFVGIGLAQLEHLIFWEDSVEWIGLVK
jgi:hypothetical protein